MVGDSTIPTTQLATRFFYVTGADGTGKTTQTDRLLADLSSQGMSPRRLWLRFAFFTSIPLLAYARWRGYSWHEADGDVIQGYWDFTQSWLLRVLLPWLMLIDAASAALFRIYLPLWLGHTIVCERFSLDMVADLEIALKDPDFHTKLPGRLFPTLIPKNSSVILLDGEPEIVSQRRADLMFDRCLPERLATYRRLADSFAYPILSSGNSIEDVYQAIRKCHAEKV